jgi:hypothetical protein
VALGGQAIAGGKSGDSSGDSCFLRGKLAAAESGEVGEDSGDGRGSVTRILWRRRPGQRAAASAR